MRMFPVLVCAILTSLACSAAETPNPAVTAFSIATAPYLAVNGVPRRFIEPRREAVKIRYEEYPSARWNALWGSFPKFVADTLRVLGDENARYEEHGALQISRGPRVILIDTVANFAAELEKRGLQFRLITLDRDITENHLVGGDVNSDHLIGFAADGAITVVCEEKTPPCAALASVSEQQLRIIEAASAAGVQQLNLYGALHGVPGQSVHVGASPFRNGSAGEMLGQIPANDTRRIGYGGPQKGELGRLSSSSERYVGFDGVRMKDAFDRLLRNPPPRGLEQIYEAIRDRDLGRLRALIGQTS